MKIFGIIIAILIIGFVIFTMLLCKFTNDSEKKIENDNKEPPYI